MTWNQSPRPIQKEINHVVAKPVANVIRGRLLLVMILFVLLAGAALSGGPPPVAHAATITVDSATNAVADDGVCTLS